MSKPNYTYRTAKHLHDLWLQLAKHKSVYFVPLNRMMPTAFFKGHIWYNALIKHFENGSFFFRRERSNAGRIKAMFKKANKRCLNCNENLTEEEIAEGYCWNCETYI